MKRIALLTVLLLAFGLASGFADDALKSGLAITGGATLSWGVDLDTGATGFQNANDVALTLTFITSFANTKSGEGAAYGTITASNITFSVDKAGAWTVWDGTLVATIVAAPLTIGVWTAPSIALGKATQVEADAAGADATDPIVDTDAFATDSYGTFGTWVSFAMAPATIKLTTVSNGDWTSNTAQAYAVAGEVALALAPLTITAGGGTGFNYAVNNPIVYVTVGLDTDMLDLTAAVDIDLATALGYDAGAWLTLTPVKDTTLVAGFYYNSDSNLDLKVVFTEPAVAGLVDNLGATVTVYVLDLMATMEYEASASLSYVMGTITPTVGFTYGSESGDDVATEVADTLLKLTAGVSVAAFPNTTLSATYTSGDLSSPNLNNPLDLGWPAGNLGTLVFAAKVAF
jgi:hypothetical protein